MFIPVWELVLLGLVAALIVVFFPWHRLVPPRTEKPEPARNDLD